MGSFFKIFFASLLALIVFCLLGFFFLIAFVGGLAKEKPTYVDSKSVLVLDMAQLYKEQAQENPLSLLSNNNEKNIPSLYDVVRLLRKAKTDKNIKGLYIKANNSPNGFAASEDIRNAVLEFKASGKFVLAHGDVISQKAYAVANAADKIYVSPQGYVEWMGFSVQYAFLKGTLEKLDIEPQIFYAGKFKSATEAFRADKMTDENRLQTTVWLNDIYNDFLLTTSTARNIDTATLHRLANEGKIQTAKDALDNKLIDGLKYDDEVREEIRTKIGLEKYDRINFISVNGYRSNGDYYKIGKDKIALIYAEGEIVDGKREGDIISSEHYCSLIRRARLDKSIKAIVFRVNSGGGSSMASENIWRELSLAKKEKPVVVSFGDVAASGGYYISCAADSIFARPSTITGSIGVFGIIPNMEGFFKNKLGITFDGVKTGEYADAMSVTHPMSENEKKMLQANVEVIYSQFKRRVADGRKKDTSYVDSIAQGRVWTGWRAKDIGLVDRFGGIDDAVACAARMAKLTDYRIKEFPEPRNVFDKLFGKQNPMDYTSKLRSEMGDDNYNIYIELKRIKEITNTPQSRLPFQFFIR